LLTLPSNVTAEATGASGASGATVNYPAATATDAVSATPVITYSQASGTVFPLGTTTVTVTAKDAANNTSTGTFTVTVVDTTGPVLTLPSNVTAEATGAGGATVSYAAASATDAVSGNPVITYSQASGTVFPLGTTTVTVTAKDAANNTSTGTFTVTVRDTMGPLLIVPSNMTAEATGASGALLNYPPATAADAVSATPVITYSQASGTVFPLGTTTVTVTAKDAANNTSTGTFTVTVRDTTRPGLTLPSNVTAEATGAGGALVNYPAATATDAVSASPVIAYSRPSGTVFPIGTTPVTVTAKDAADNTSTGTFTVTVRDTTGPVLTPPSNVTAEATGAGGATVSYPAATAADAVSASPVITYSKASGTVFPLGTTTVTVTAQDAAGNVSSAAFNVTVSDTTGPVLTLPSSVTAEATGEGGATVNYAAATATDAVSASPVITYSKASGTVFPLGTTTVTVTAKDAANNASTATFTVTVRDTTAPEFVVPSNVVVDATSAAGAVVSYAMPAASDAVGVVSLTASRASGSVFPIGATNVELEARDLAGNAKRRSFEVRVLDRVRLERVPVRQALVEGGSVELSVGASGYRALRYQWKKGGDILEGEQASALRRSGVSAGDAGLYRVVVSNVDGGEESEDVELRVMQWPQLAGNYQGLLLSSDGAAYARMTAALNRTGTMSVMLQIQGQTFRFVGKWQRELTFEREVRVNNGSTVKFRMRLDGFEKRMAVNAESTGGEVLSGSGDLWFVDPTSEGSTPYVSKRYGLLWEPISGSTGVPKAPGYATVLVSRTGTAVVAGKLGDGTSMTASAYLTKAGAMPLYAPLYGGVIPNAGYVASVVEFEEKAGGVLSASGGLTWKRPVRRVGGVEVAGFLARADVVGSEFTGLESVSGNELEVRLMDENGGSGEVRWRVRRNQTGAFEVVGADEERMQMEVNAGNGAVSGRYTDWGRGKVVRLWGVVAPGLGRGGGVAVDGDRVLGWRLSAPAASGAE
jgi:hypothetical protein